MIKNYKNIWIFSDVHLCHKNIHKYERENREKIGVFFWLEYTNKNNSIYWQEFIKNFIKYIIKEKENKWFLYYINLGDFIFSPTEEKIDLLWEENVNKLLENNVFVLWNHDLQKKGDYDLINFNNNWDISIKNIDNLRTKFIHNIIKKSSWFKVFHLIEDKENKILNIFTHYPLDSTFSDEYHIHNLFKNIDKYLINLIDKKYKDYHIVNYHGHTHSHENNIKNDKIEYINCCIDNLTNN